MLGIFWKRMPPREKNSLGTVTVVVGPSTVFGVQTALLGASGESLLYRLPLFSSLVTLAR